MQLFVLIYMILYSLMMITISNSVLILKIYATLPILVIHVDFVRFTKEIIALLKMFYNEDGQKSRKVLKIQKF